MLDKELIGDCGAIVSLAALFSAIGVVVVILVGGL